MASEILQDSNRETIHQTHQLLKACWQCTVLAGTHLDVLKGKEKKKNVTLDKLHKFYINTEIIEWTNTHIFDQGGEDCVCASQFPQQCNGTGARKQRRLDQLV